MKNIISKIIFSIYFFSHISIGADSLAQEQTAENVLQDAEKVLVKLSDSNSVPKQTRLSKLDSSIFFVNSSKDSLLSLEIDFGKHKSHCASGNMKWFQQEGILRSNEPIAPRDFAIMCFPESGTYDVKIYGLNKNGSPTKTQVIVP